MESVSELLDAVANETGSIAPLLFLFALLSGVVGSLLSRHFFRRSAGDRQLDLALALIHNSNLSDAEKREQYRRVIESVVTAQNRLGSTSKVIARFGEYVSNQSPIDSITKVSE